MKFLSFLLIAFLLVACGGNPESTPIPVAAAPTDTPAPTATTAPTSTPTPEPTVTPIAFPSDTPTPEPTATSSPLPTNTPTPSATPAPAASVTGDSINLRGGPGTVYPVIGKANKGESFPVISRTEDGGWLEVALAGGKQAWVSAKLVTINMPVESLAVAVEIPPTPKAPPTAVPSRYASAEALQHVRMVVGGDPQGVGQIQFPSGANNVWCAYEVNTSLGKPGQYYSLRVLDATGNVVAQTDLVEFSEGLKPGTRVAIAAPVKPQSGVFPNGVYRTEILLNGQVIATLAWSVG